MILSREPSFPAIDSCDQSEDRFISREEVEVLRNWMRAEGIPDDEAPELPESAYHDPDLSDDQNGAFGMGGVAW